MKRQEIKNIAASVRQRLLNKARATGSPFNELLQYFAMERFLYRLTQSPHGEKFVLKGALMLAMWEVSLTRPTKDIDLLGHITNNIDEIVAIVKDVCRLEVQPDGLSFDPDSVQGEKIAEEAEYAGIRVRFKGNLGTAAVSMRIDIGFGDAIVPDPEISVYPTILDMPAPRIRGYSRESLIAEKFHAMVRRGILNSRMRDFFDVWALSRQFEFDGRLLSSAIRETFTQRDLQVDSSPIALTEQFSADTAKAAQWRGFVRKNRLESAPGDLTKVVEAIAVFLGPIAEALNEGLEFKGRWRAPGPWSPV